VWNPNNTDVDNRRLSYGAQFVCPWETGIIRNVVTGDPINERGNGLWIERQKEDGTWEAISFWHNSINFKKDGDVVKYGEIVALMGNSGFCDPMPSPDFPSAGTHCHFRYQTMKKNSDGANYDIITLNPMDYFDINSWFVGSDSSVEIDAEPIKWGIAKKGITTIWDKIIYTLKVLGLK
jgi:hypothetical protein